MRICEYSSITTTTNRTQEQHPSHSNIIPGNIAISISDLLQRSSSLSTPQTTYVASVAPTSRVTMICLKDNCIDYDIFSASSNTPYKTLHHNLQQLITQLHIQNQPYSPIITAQINLLSTYSNIALSTNNVIHSSQDKPLQLLNEQVYHSMHASINQVKLSIQSNNYMYSIYTLDTNSTFREIRKGISQNLASIISGSTQAHIDRLLRFGDIDLFNGVSKTNQKLSLIQQIINMQQLNNFGSVQTENNTIYRYLKRSFVCHTRSRIIPLTERIVNSAQQIQVFYAFMHVVEMSIDPRQIDNRELIMQSDLSLSSNSSQSSLNSEIENEKMNMHHQGYLDSIQEFQNKYYADETTAKKKRKRKTKAEVEREVQYYLNMRRNLCVKEEREYQD